MMKQKGLQITNNHGWAIERLTMKKANMAKRMVVIRLIM
jgi:hypothetical protein